MSTRAALPMTFAMAVTSFVARESVALAAPHARSSQERTHYRQLCPNADAHGRRCYGQVLVDGNDRPISDATSPPGGWTPAELQAAYGLPKAGRNGKTIATYIGAHYTNAEADMATYRSKFGLSPCTSANGCFKQVNATGGADFSGLSDDGCDGGVGEESLDMAMLQAGCPDCKILLIEGNDDAAAIATAKKLGAVSLSMSWGTEASVSDCDTAFKPPPGIALFAATGDSGFSTSPGEPSACANVIAVGWTQLATDTSARGYADTLPADWGSAGGCSPVISKGVWQKDPSCSRRMVSDVSANGDNVALYCTSPAGSANWQVAGGSSASSPFTSGIFAMLGITSLPGFGPSWLYDNQSKFWDVSSGGPVANCPAGSPPYFCSAVSGYDGPTGVGTPYGPGLTGATDGGAGDAGNHDAGGPSGTGDSGGAGGGGNGSGGSVGSTPDGGANDASAGGAKGAPTSDSSDSDDTSGFGAPPAGGCVVAGRSDANSALNRMPWVLLVLGIASRTRRRMADTSDRDRSTPRIDRLPFPDLHQTASGERITAKRDPCKE